MIIIVNAGLASNIRQLTMSKDEYAQSDLKCFKSKRYNNIHQLTMSRDEYAESDLKCFKSKGYINNEYA
jgi:formiminotetrahydrofolate cyclodeaminase